MPYFSSDSRLEKVEQIKRLTLQLNLTVGLNVAPTLASVVPGLVPTGAATVTAGVTQYVTAPLVNLVTAVGAATTAGGALVLTPAGAAGFTFTGLTTGTAWGAATNAPTFGIEVADATISAAAILLGAKGFVVASGAGNISPGAPVFSTALFSYQTAPPYLALPAVQLGAGGIGMTLQAGLGVSGTGITATGYSGSLNAAAGTVSVLIDILYLDR
jgi:hypothetical protein